MIQYLQKDITTVDHGVICHGVNCEGVMGAGIALAIKTRWPEVYARYREHVDQYPHDLLGTCHFVRLREYLLVANMFTQRSYGRTGKYADIDAIKKSLNRAIMMGYQDYLPIYTPKVGCGLGGLDWDKDVKPIIERLASHYNEVRINVVEL